MTAKKTKQPAKQPEAAPQPMEQPPKKKQPTQTAVKEMSAGLKKLLEALHEIETTGEPYLADAAAFMTQAIVMLDKHLATMTGGKK